MIDYQNLYLVPHLAKTHALLMSITFVIVFPTGAFLIRLLKLKGSRAVWTHAGLQLAGVVMLLAGVAEGVRMGKIIDRVGSASPGGEGVST
jgi:hypothetical protein